MANKFKIFLYSTPDTGLKNCEKKENMKKDGLLVVFLSHHEMAFQYQKFIQFRFFILCQYSCSWSTKFQLLECHLGRLFEAVPSNFLSH